MKATLDRRFLIVLCTLIFLSTACALPSMTQNTPNVAQTLAVQTIDAMMTDIAGSSITATPGGADSNPVTGGATAAASTQAAPTLRPSATPQPTATQIILPSATATSICDLAGFISDITVPDGSSIAAGAQFVKTWRLRNNGTCTWTKDYSIVFDSGDSLNGPASQKLGEDVSPGQTIDVSVTLRAPAKTGSYKGNWKMRNAAGVLFGLGGQVDVFYVVIKVVNATTSSNGYDFTANACQAEWSGNGKALPCTGADGSEDGFVLYVAKPALEGGSVDNEPGLITNPPKINDGVIRGKYPAYTVTNKDHFTTLIGCEYKATNCNVRFQLDYQIDNGSIQTLASWVEAYEGNTTQVDYNLSSLAGKNVRFILTVYAIGESNGDRALWLLPRIQQK